MYKHGPTYLLVCVDVEWCWDEVRCVHLHMDTHLSICGTNNVMDGWMDGYDTGGVELEWELEWEWKWGEDSVKIHMKHNTI